MSNVIQFLEAMGSNAVMARMSPADYEKAVLALETGETLGASLRFRDSAKLADLLGTRSHMMCMVMAPDDQSEERSPDDAEESPIDDEPNDA